MSEPVMPEDGVRHGVRRLRRDDDLSPSELLSVLDLADEVKKDRFARRPLEWS